MIKLNQTQIKKFQQEILSWYPINKRDLPWRKTRDPYSILVSEMMAQQTQLSRVIPKYEAWMRVLPAIYDLAKASTAEVLKLWSGLGYNRRALYLQKAVQEIVAKYNGKFPQEEKILQTLPGIGEYTSRAVLCFAFDKQIAVVDTNVKKVIVIKFPISNFHTPRVLASRKRRFQISNKKEIQEIADRLLPIGHAYEWNQALMDYSAAVLKKEKVLIPKQSKFKDSNRFYRGQIVKLLVNYEQLSQERLFSLLHDKNPQFEKIRFEKIVTGLNKDGLIKAQKETLSLS